jgi:hypothetical protein
MPYRFISMLSPRIQRWREEMSRTYPARGYQLNLADFNIRDSQITSQMSVLNSAFSTCGISWVLANTTRTVNADWFNSAAPSTPQQTAMKSALRQGNVKDLNVYTVGFVGPSENSTFFLTSRPQIYLGFWCRPSWLCHIPFLLRC